MKLRYHEIPLFQTCSKRHSVLIATPKMAVNSLEPYSATTPRRHPLRSEFQPQTIPSSACTAAMQVHRPAKPEAKINSISRSLSRRYGGYLDECLVQRLWFGEEGCVVCPFQTQHLLRRVGAAHTLLERQGDGIVLRGLNVEPPHRAVLLSC